MQYPNAAAAGLLVRPATAAEYVCVSRGKLVSTYCILGCVRHSSLLNRFSLTRNQHNAIQYGQCMLSPTHPPALLRPSSAHASAHAFLNRDMLYVGSRQCSTCLSLMRHAVTAAVFCTLVSPWLRVGTALMPLVQSDKTVEVFSVLCRLRSSRLSPCRSCTMPLMLSL